MNGRTNLSKQQQQQQSSDDSWSVDGGDAIDLGRDSTNTDEHIHGIDEKNEADDVVQKLIKNEAQGVYAWKVTTVLTMLLLALAVSCGTFFFLDKQEKDSFENSYTLFVNAASDSTQTHVEQLFHSLQYVAEHITKDKERTKDNFPFITLPFFDVLGFQARQTTLANFILWAPLVPAIDVSDWNEYSVKNQNWINTSQHFEALRSSTGTSSIPDVVIGVDSIQEQIWEMQPNGESVTASERDVHQPVWQISPLTFAMGAVNMDIPSSFYLYNIALQAQTLRHGVVGPVISDDLVNQRFDIVNFLQDKREPGALVAEPIVEDLFNPRESPVVGHVFASISWRNYLRSLIPDGVRSVSLVIHNTCDQYLSFELLGNNVTYLGEGDQHDRKYNNYKRVIPFYPSDHYHEQETTEGHCLYSFYMYPTRAFEDTYRTSLPLAMAILVASTFVCLVSVFFMYDLFVQRRNHKMQDAVQKSNALVLSMFPSNVRDRLFAAEDDNARNRNLPANGKNRLKSYLATGGLETNEGEGEEEDQDFYKTKPIADLFPDTTVLFADISGFTAWSSTREPTQVFILLETIYKAFDDIARSRGVFKVETVGDCYVAVTGLPDPRKDHAVAMCRFAVDCMHKMRSLTKKLEIRLGPDTTDLDMRFGLHSGPVTAGVLRGERSRFQLFGDTMNTASRMESNGKPGMIQLSQETADLLAASGKTHWFTPRDDRIIAKGKGELQTYWLSLSLANKASEASVSEGSEGQRIEAVAAPQETTDLVAARDEKTERLVQWNVEVLLSLLRKVIANRGYSDSSSTMPVQDETRTSSTVLEEVVEIISLPHFDAERQQASQNPENVVISAKVEDQLKEYVSSIAAMYRDNPFHNFEHASHVTMSVVKLLSRIVTPDVDAVNSDMESTLHVYTYGITSDPLTQFACVFSALIHDVDHSGVPNTQLVVENPTLAVFYKNKSVAEQNSVDLSWDLLQDSSFSDLRAAIYATQDEKIRFRQLVVNSVMATDIMDKGLKALRNNRWEKAFAKGGNEESSKDAMDRKATIVIEHLIQASDVAHTMQHWHIYRKWNERLFQEMYKAYMDGRAATDPGETWYKGEIGFFDFYIIPLAKKLKDCGVFGVSSDEYLNYAEKNRQEWDQRGQEVVSSMIEAATKRFGTKQIKRDTTNLLNMG